MSQEDILNVFKKDPERWFTIAEVHKLSKTTSTIYSTMAKLNKLYNKWNVIDKRYGKGAEYKLR